VFSNIAAVVTVAIAVHTTAWWVDPVGEFIYIGDGIDGDDDDDDGMMMG